MKDTLSKEITECYRIKYSNDGTRKGYRSYRSAVRQAVSSNDIATIDELPRRQSIAARKQTNRNFDFGENLSPLVRWVAAQVGRPWDNVFSELKNCLPKGALGDHVLLHLEDEVELNCTKENGVVYDSAGREIVRSWRHYGPTGRRLYVDQSGILKEIRPPKDSSSGLLVDYETKIGPHFARWNEKKGYWEAAVIYRNDEHIPLNTKFISVVTRQRLRHETYQYYFWNTVYEQRFIRHWRRLSNKELRHFGEHKPSNNQQKPVSPEDVLAAHNRRKKQRPGSDPKTF